MNKQNYKIVAVLATIVALTCGGVLFYTVTQPAKVKTEVKVVKEPAKQKPQSKSGADQTRKGTTTDDNKATSIDDKDKKLEEAAASFVKTIVEFNGNVQAKHNQLKKMSSEDVANAIAPVGDSAVSADSVPYTVTWQALDSSIIKKAGVQTAVLIHAQYKVIANKQKVTNDFVYMLTFNSNQVRQYAVYNKLQPQGTLR